MGVLLTLLALGAGGYWFMRSGRVSMATTAPPLPLEKTVAELALRGSMGNAADKRNPLTFNDGNMVAAVKTYKDHCAVCHGTPERPPTALSKGMFPPPPQLFEKADMMLEDPQGETFWKVTHGIRLSGMPGFGTALTETQRWQLAMLVAHADNLTNAVQAEFRH